MYVLSVARRSTFHVRRKVEEEHNGYIKNERITSFYIFVAILVSENK